MDQSALIMTSPDTAIVDSIPPGTKPKQLRALGAGSTSAVAPWSTRFPGSRKGRSRPGRSTVCWPACRAGNSSRRSAWDPRFRSGSTSASTSVPDRGRAATECDHVEGIRDRGDPGRRDRTRSGARRAARARARGVDRGVRGAEHALPLRSRALSEEQGDLPRPRVLRGEGAATPSCSGRSAIRASRSACSSSGSSPSCASSWICS